MDTISDLNKVFTKHLNKIKAKYSKYQYVNYKKLEDITLYTEHYDDGFYILVQ